MLMIFSKLLILFYHYNCFTAPKVVIKLELVLSLSLKVTIIAKNNKADCWGELHGTFVAVPLHCSGVVFFFIVYISECPVLCVNKELLNLKTVGGRGCRPINNDSPPWIFPVLSHSASTQFVTPADNSSLLECTDDAGSDNDDDSNSWSGSEDEDIALSEDSSYCTEDDAEVDYVDMLGRGNRLISLPVLTSAVNCLASCKYCYRDQMENEFESFLK
jgi:hypothetical protein